MVDLLLSWRRERDGMERRWQSVVKKSWQLGAVAAESLDQGRFDVDVLMTGTVRQESSLGAVLVSPQKGLLQLRH